MIWDEALTGICVIALSLCDNVVCPGHALWARCGFDPLLVALSCKQAASRWRALYPFRMVQAEPLRDMRLKQDCTVLFSDYSHKLIVFEDYITDQERLGDRDDGIRAENAAYHDLWMGDRTLPLDDTTVGDPLWGLLNHHAIGVATVIPTIMGEEPPFNLSFVSLLG